MIFKIIFTALFLNQVEYVSKVFSIDPTNHSLHNFQKLFIRFNPAEH